MNPKFHIYNLKSRKGQSLVEIIIALAIGAVLVGAAATAVVVVLRSGTITQGQQNATVLAQGFAEQARSFAEADWQNIYALNKGSSTVYYFNTSSTELFVIEGEEGVVVSDARGGLIGHWKLDEAGGNIAYDHSINSNNGSVQNATRATSTSCQAGGCLVFSGSGQYVNAGEDPSLRVLGALTLLAWMRADVVPGISDTGIAGTDINAYQLTYHSDGQVWFYINNSSIRTPVGSGEWHHVTGVWDGTTGSNGMKLYIDGVLAVQGASGQFPISGWQNFLIGREPDGNYFDGRLDEVRIYNRVLTESEIKNLYSSDIFTRYFYVENACRSNDSYYNITGVEPCDAGSVNDPSTQKITTVLKWSSDSQFVLSDYLTRWRNRIFNQTDWSGGSGEEGPVTEVTDKYASSTDISISTGFIRIEGI